MNGKGITLAEASLALKKIRTSEVFLLNRGNIRRYTEEARRKIIGWLMLSSSRDTEEYKYLFPLHKHPSMSIVLKKLN